MPAALMHIRGAALLLDRGAVPPGVRAAVERASWCYRLGALLPDLPLFDGFWRKVALFLLARPYPESRWGTVVHARGAGSLAAAILWAGRTGRTEEHLALTAGLLTHVALDRCLHAPIEEAVRLHLRPSESWAQLHEAVEGFHCLDWHRRHRSSDGLGTSEVAEIAVAPAGGRSMPGWARETLHSALERTYGLAPRRAELARWAAGLAAYRATVGGPAGRLGVRSSERFARARPWVRGLELEPALEDGLGMASRFLAEAEDANRSGSPGRLARAVGNGPLV